MPHKKQVKEKSFFFRWTKLVLTSWQKPEM
jgi:hypothetical protein